MFETKLKEIIANQLSISIEDINDDDDIMDDLMADSIDVVEMVMEVEDTFGIQISDERLIENRRVGDICEMLKDLQEIN